MVNEAKKERHTGIITWFGFSNYGFIKPYSDITDGKDIFLHGTAMRDAAAEPKEGDRVSFILDTSSEKGIKARDVEFIEE